MLALIQESQPTNTIVNAIDAYYNKLLVADKVNINLLDQKIDIVMNDTMDKVKINLKN